MSIICHIGIKFENQVIPLTGHEYKKCTFTGCTLVFNGFPTLISECIFQWCHWKVDFVAHDFMQWLHFQKTLAPLIQDVLASQEPLTDDEANTKIRASAVSGSPGTSTVARDKGGTANDAENGQSGPATHS